MHQFCEQWVTTIWSLLCLFKLSCGSYPHQERPTFFGHHSNLCMSIWIPVKMFSAVLPPSRSKFYHPPWRPVDFQKITADGDKHSGSDPGVESHGKREGKAENSQYDHGQMPCGSRRKAGCRRSWLWMALALLLREVPSRMQVAW